VNLDKKYVDLLIPILHNSRQKSHSIRLQCPYCQSGNKISPGKCKGYLYEINGDWNFKCHKCSTGKSLGNFLKDHFSEHYLQYVIERDRAGLTGWGSNCPKLETTLKDKGFLSSPPQFGKDGDDSLSNSSDSSDRSGGGQKAPGCDKTPRITKLPPMCSPQQQAGQQAHLNHLIKQRQKRLDDLRENYYFYLLENLNREQQRPSDHTNPQSEIEPKQQNEH